MKNLLITAIAAFSISAQAQVSQNDLEVCKLVGKGAQIAMTERQNGTDMVTMLQRAGDNKLAAYLVTQAYKQPKYTSSDYQQRAIVGFGNKMIESCIHIKGGQ